MPDKYLAIYLNDHLAGSTVGVELAKRTRSANAGTEFEGVLSGLVDEIETDRETLRELMRALDVGEDRLKKAAAWAGEKVGRFKLNGQLTGYSPLSRMIEFEGLALGITGKKALWKALVETLQSDPRVGGFDFAALAQRAQSQLDALEPCRLRAAELAFADHPPE